MSRFCPNCGTKLVYEDAKFCSDCGYSLIIETVQVKMANTNTKFDTTYPLPDDVRNLIKPLRGNQINFQTSLSFEQIATFYRRAFTERGLNENESFTNITEDSVSFVFNSADDNSMVVLQAVDLAYSSNTDSRNVNIRTENSLKNGKRIQKPISAQNKQTLHIEEAPQKINDQLEKPIIVPDKQIKNYIVYVDDNFHHMDESERYKLGEFKTCEGAVAACEKIVDEFLKKGYENGMSFKELYSGYTMFGEDPFIVSDDERCRFSAWDYAKKRCRELCSED